VYDTIAVTLDSTLRIKMDSLDKVCDTSIVLNPGQNRGSAYLWSNKDTSQTIRVDKSGRYWVTVTDQNGCSVSDTSIVMLLAPVLFGDNNLKDTTFCSDKGPLILDAGTAYRYHWLPGNDTTQKIAITDSGKYTVQITGADGCTAIKSAQITDDCTPSLYIPNAFSPDGNGDNDVFMAYGTNISGFSMRIYNRWGERLFDCNNLDTGWDGRFHDTYCSTGTYIYIIEYSTWINPGSKIKKTGTIYLKR
jgi:gliding motility-associated-like protein